MLPQRKVAFHLALPSMSALNTLSPCANISSNSDCILSNKGPQQLTSVGDKFLHHTDTVLHTLVAHEMLK